ncbi:MAG: isoleucine--tRNA ligase [Pseudomonadota bacterium]|nr:isoleucine--tRNA ligase [Pseudomonadota bacterium]
MDVDYKLTVNLPKTVFPMKAGLAKKEAELLKRWQVLDIYSRHRDLARGRKKFILHDGPPYANGNLHIGHALNKILKDVITRSQQMLGKDANYVPGWDCHGLPIEWKIEEKYRKSGEDKDSISIVEFRRECREFAEHWINIQREEFKRLGIIGDWNNPYTTMTFEAEAQIVEELGKFLANKSLYRGAKPVLWSVVEKTALAEAEVEYHDHESNTIFVRFKIRETQNYELTGEAAILIWTTTPWTIPGNRGIAYSSDDKYVRLEVVVVKEGSLAQVGEEIIVAKPLLAEVCKECLISEYKTIKEFDGADLKGIICDHPFKGKGYDFEVPLLAGNFVEMETGSGFVHIAPGHGSDDWVLGKENGLQVPETVLGDGLFADHVPIFGGQHVFKTDPLVKAELESVGCLIGFGKIQHSYPHSWRSKAPLIFRNTPQWFISMESDNLREKALDAIESTSFFPASGKNRLKGMIESRPDWCVSRQRSWGVPITVFVNKTTGEILRDPFVIKRIITAVREEGADVWFTSDPSRFLGPDYIVEDYTQVKDILDVWFDSGSTHSFVLENREDLEWPASLYLEGSDQHRGWFHSSLLESCGTRNRAPYNAVLTHGFVMAEDGQKMSKSLGNITAPQEVVEKNGADVLRLWVVGSDYSEDLRIGPEIIKYHTDIYRRLRNTQRYLLGNLDSFSEGERVEVTQMPELERWVLHRIFEFDKMVRLACDKFEFHTLFTELHNFCTVDLSAFYFDIRKDSLYCDIPESIKRRSVRTVLDNLFRYLTIWFAPFICFTAEEAWLARYPGDEESVHLQLFPDVPVNWKDSMLAERWGRIREIRKVVTGAIERERSEKRLGSSLESHPVVYLKESDIELITLEEYSEILITSNITLTLDPVPTDAFVLEDVNDVGVVCKFASGSKCARCYKVLPEVGTVKEHKTICVRCINAVENFAQKLE